MAVMKIAILILAATACGAASETSSEALGSAPFANYRCQVYVDAGDCLARFLAGEDSPCVYTRDGTSIEVVRPNGSAFQTVATCSP